MSMKDNLAKRISTNERETCVLFNSLGLENRSFGQAPFQFSSVDLFRLYK